MDLSKLSNADIQAAIQKMQKGIEIKPGSVEASELQISIDRALEELQRRAQKKSDQLTGNPGQLPIQIDLDAALKEIASQEWPKIKEKLEAQENGKNLVKQLEQFKDSNIPPLPSDMQTGQQLLDKWEQERHIFSAPTKASEQTIPVLLLGWKQAKEMNRSQIRAEARRYFNAVFTSAKFKTAYSDENLSELWSMKMYCNLWALCEAYNQLAKRRFEMEDLLQNYWSYTQANRDLASELVEFLNEPQPE